MDDSAMYTGVDIGQFGNEELDTQTKEMLTEEREKRAELTPKLKGLIDMVDAEIKLVMSIDRFINAANQPEENIKAEVQAAALYKKYLDVLKTKFVLQLEETKK